ncbi:MAG: B12-binding domain-containing radical SAM protein [Candidatus Thorarchaeota archaeon]
MAKVLLTVPKSNCAITESLEYTSPPLGIGYVASYIREHGKHDVKIHDGLLRNSNSSDFNTVLSSFSPDVVGISGQTTPSIHDVYRTAKAVKNYNPAILVVVGGAHVTFQDKQVLRDCPEIDVVVRGEGEVTMHALLEKVNEGHSFSNVVGTTSRRNGTIGKNPDRPFISDLDCLPFPAYDLLRLHQYFPKGNRFAPMITSRGCPYRCTFCSSSRITGKRWRGRSPENVIQEIQYLQDKYRVRDITFIDDLFTFDHQRVADICELINEEADDITWTCSSRADIISRHPEMASWLKRAGCHTIYIGAESGSQRILNKIKKGIQLTQIVRSVGIAKKVGLQVVLSFILGIPGETEEDMRSTIDFACRLDPDLAQFTICTPYPGTPMYDEAMENDWISAKDWSEFTVIEPVLDLPELSRASIKKHLKRAYYKFYSRPCLIWKQIKMRNLDFFRVVFRTILNRYRK